MIQLGECKSSQTLCLQSVYLLFYFSLPLLNPQWINQPRLFLESHSIMVFPLYQHLKKQIHDSFSFLLQKCECCEASLCGVSFYSSIHYKQPTCLAMCLYAYEFLMRVCDHSTVLPLHPKVVAHRNTKLYIWSGSFSFSIEISTSDRNPKGAPCSHICSSEALCFPNTRHGMIKNSLISNRSYREHLLLY